LPTFTYRDVRMVLAEPDQIFADNVIDALSSRGIRDPLVCRTAEALRMAMAMPVDLLLCDVDLPGLDFQAVVQDIRHSRLGTSPFVIVIATARPSTLADLPRVITSGIDYIVLKPMPADQLARRVDGFTRGRKPFVVTADFIGPSRRARRRDDGSDDDVVQVPNTLRVKVLFNDRLALLDKLLEFGHGQLGKKRSETRLNAVTRLVRRLIELHQQHKDSPNAADWQRGVGLLVEKIGEVVAEHMGSPATDHVGEIAARVGQIARRWGEANARPTEVEVALLAQLADALLGASVTDGDAADIAREIAAMVDRFLAKDEGEAEDGGTK